MDNQKYLWFEELPEVFEREKFFLESKGFTLKEQNGHIEFVGRSSILKEYPLRIIYPDGYPSFPPKVISDVPDELVLIRHQRKLNKTLCCFGFSSERWRADFTAREVLQEAEDLIVNYSPLTVDDEFEFDHDFAPEPIVNQYDYEAGGMLIPTPFGDMEFTDFKSVNDAELYFSVMNKRGKLKEINVQDEKYSVHSGYKDWFSGSTLYKTKVYKLNTPPPLSTADIKVWLVENNIRINLNKNGFIFFVFKDEWGKKGNMRVAWLCLKIVQSKASWIKCYLVSEEDRNIRTPFGYKLKGKTVTIIGAGSLGSIVATTLAQEGVGKFNLVDYDTYEPSNSIRHQVKQFWFGLPKAKGVGNRIKELVPTAEVDIFEYPLGHSINSRTINQVLESSDIVVDTTGEHSVSHYLNRFCVINKIPLIIGSVTNGAWSCEVIRYIPNHSGCWGCWHRSYGNRLPPSSPYGEMQFAPGCDQPTFIGGISSINISGGLVAQAVIDTLSGIHLDDKHYILWSERDAAGNRQYSVEYLRNSALEGCEVCYEDK